MIDEGTRASWDVATHNHNAHKGDQAAFFRGGGDTLFPEELQLLGEIRGRSLVHLQCNAGQDSISLARRGADVTGVDFSSEAVRFARSLAAATDTPAAFHESEVVAWLESTEQRFDLAFSSYGCVGWLPDQGAWARGIARVLRPGGRFVYVEFHPIVWSFDEAARPAKDDYFARGPYDEPVGDYVAVAGDALGAVGPAVPAGENTIVARSFQYTLAETTTALAGAGLVLETLAEWPHANGARVTPALVRGPGRTWVWPAGVARLPVMFGLVLRRPA